MFFQIAAIPRYARGRLVAAGASGRSMRSMPYAPRFTRWRPENARTVRRSSQANPLIASRVIVALATVAAGVVLIRALPDLIRYMRVRRM